MSLFLPIHVWNRLLIWLILSDTLLFTSSRKPWILGDKKTVVGSAIHPHAKLNKRHTALSFHQDREAIASKMVDF